MADITIYTTKICPYCVQAKNLLKRKGLSESDWNEIDASDPEIRVSMVEKANGMRTVPQIFIAGQHVGGFDDMNALDKKGELDALLTRAK